MGESMGESMGEFQNEMIFAPTTGLDRKAP
jgi:hypothetical protein